MRNIFYTELTNYFWRWNDIHYFVWLFFSPLDSATNDCLPNPCLNDGICTDGDGSFSCQCVQGFMGDTCETSRSSVRPQGSFFLKVEKGRPHPNLKNDHTQNWMMTKCGINKFALSLIWGCCHWFRCGHYSVWVWSSRHHSVWVWSLLGVCAVAARLGSGHHSV